MSANNGVLRISRKGKSKFAFGEEGAANDKVFEVDVVETFQRWIDIDDSFRELDEVTQTHSISSNKMADYHKAAVEFAKELSGVDVTIAEAMDFLARMREVYDDLTYFFHPRSREERGLPDISVGASGSTSPKTELRFSVEAP